MGIGLEQERLIKEVVGESGCWIFGFHIKDTVLGTGLLSLGINQLWEGQSLPVSAKSQDIKALE